MKASCAICTENFTDDSEISAVPCGHTFHDECLQKWFLQSKTCPQCRKTVIVRNVIHKLFFTDGDGDESQADVGKLKNELNALRLNLRQKDKEKVELENDQGRLLMRISGLQDNVKSAQQRYQQEKSQTDTLKKELSYMKKMQTEAQLAKEEAASLRRKLKDLKNIQEVVNGMVTDIEEKVKNSNTQDLAKWCVIQEKELRRKRADCRKFQDEAQKESRENAKLKRTLADRTQECAALEEKLSVSEKDVTSLEKQNLSLKKKLDALQQALDSPSDTNLERRFARRLINESPAPLKRPRLTEPSAEIDLDISSEILGQSKETQGDNKHSKKHKATKNVKMTSAAAGSRTNKEAVKDISNIPASLSALNILKKTRVGSGFMRNDAGSSVMKKGYNGLGGHETFIQPRGHPLAASLKNMKRAAPAGSNHSTSGKSSRFKIPPLPSLQ